MPKTVSAIQRWNPGSFMNLLNSWVSSFITEFMRITSTGRSWTGHHFRWAAIWRETSHVNRRATSSKFRNSSAVGASSYGWW